MKQKIINKYLFIILLFNVISAIANDCYINLLDTNGVWKDRIQLFNENTSLVNFDIVCNDEEIVLYKLIINNTDDSKLNDRLFNNQYFLRIFKKTDTRYYKITEKPMYSSKYTKYLHVEISNDLEHQEGMLPVINTDNLNCLYKLDTFKSPIFFNSNTNKYNPKAIILKILLKFLDFAEHMSRQIDIQASLDCKNILKTFTKYDITFLEIPDYSLFSYIFYKFGIDNGKKMQFIMHSLENTVDYLHNSKKIVHGDIKFANLFVKNDTVVLSGFENAQVLINSSNVRAPKDSFYANNDLKVQSYSKSNFYRNINYKDDKYYLGVAFTIILYYFSTSYLEYIGKLEDFTPAYRLEDLAIQQKLQFDSFDRYPYQTTWKITKSSFFYLYSYSLAKASIIVCRSNKDNYDYSENFIHRINALQAEYVEEKKKYRKQQGYNIYNAWETSIISTSEEEFSD